MISNEASQRDAEPLNDAVSAAGDLVIFTATNAAYEDFVALFAAAAVHHVENARVEVGVADPGAFAAVQGPRLEVVWKHYGSESLKIVPAKFEMNGRPVLPNTVRFITEPSRAEFVYIGDVDIIILERSLKSIHLEFMRKTGLPYSNSARQVDLSRLSGLHFTRFDAMYPLPDLSDIDLSRENDERVLRIICERKGLPIQEDEWFRPQCGIHISPNRAPIPAHHGKLAFLGWGIHKYIDEYIAFSKTDVCVDLRKTLSPRLKWALETIDYYCGLRQTYPGWRPAAPVPVASSVAAAPPATSAEAVFSGIHATRAWKGTSVSGPGSSLQATRLLRPALVELFRELDIRSLCDSPCGDAGWIGEIVGGLDYYIGVDVVPELVAQNAREPRAPRMAFLCADIAKTPLPRADAVLCRDCLVHLPLEMAQAVIANIRASGARWMLATTFPTRTENIQARIGTWRPLNLEIAPFDLPPPERLIAERAPNPADRYADKSIGVWRLR